MLVSMSISSGCTIKTAADTLVCTLLERLSATVLIIEPLLILDISSGSRTTTNNHRL
jgi:hypothetical protein